jgi:hypothetical protein
VILRPLAGRIQRHPGVGVVLPTLMLLAAAGMAIAVASADTGSVRAPGLYVSNSPDRSSAAVLAGPLDGVVYIFDSGVQPGESVKYFLDGNYVRTEMRSPYDLMGTNSDTTAAPLDATTLPDGDHSVSATVVTPDGTTDRIDLASFSTGQPVAPGPSGSPSPSPSDSPPDSPSVSPSVSASASPSRSASASASPSASPSPSLSPSPTDDPSPSDSPSPSPSVKPSTSVAPSKSPTPSVSPSPTKPPPPTKPPSGGFPGAGNTGPSGPLTLVNGNLTITTPGTYSNLDVQGSVIVKAAGVTLSNIKIEPSGGDFAVRNMSSGHVTLTDCDLGPSSSSGHGIQAAVVFSDYTLNRCDVHGTADGLKANGNTTITNSWIHDLYCDGSYNHPDGIQVSAGSNVLIRHNTIDNQCRDASGAPHLGVSDVMIKSDQGPISNVSLDGNKMLGYVRLCVYDVTGGNGVPTGISITNNVFTVRSTGGVGWTVGTMSADSPGPAWSGNTDTSGAPA